MSSGSHTRWHNIRQGQSPQVLYKVQLAVTLFRATGTGIATTTMDKLVFLASGHGKQVIDSHYQIHYRFERLHSGALMMLCFVAYIHLLKKL